MNTIKLTLVSLFVISCAGCSNFDQTWRKAGESGASSGVARYDGRWISDHHKAPSGAPMGGRLRCVLTPVDHTKVRALFHANWLCFSGDYEVELLRRNASKSASGRLTGTHDLPAIFGGTYRYDAEIAGLRFTARYSSKYDAGVFDMTQQLTKRESIH